MYEYLVLLLLIYLGIDNSDRCVRYETDDGAKGGVVRGVLGGVEWRL